MCIRDRPNSIRANDEYTIERLRNDNVGDNPYVYKLKSNEETRDVLKAIIIDNAGGNIGVLVDTVSQVDKFHEMIRHHINEDVSYYYSAMDALEKKKTISCYQMFLQCKGKTK